MCLLFRLPFLFPGCMHTKLILKGANNMAYLETNEQNGQYQKCTLVLSANERRGNIHVFKTRAGTQSIAPMVSTTAVALENMNPTGILASKVIAKTNAGMFDRRSKKFHGIYYLGGTNLYINGEKFTSAPASSIAYTDGRFWPSFCVKKDGTANIRWFSSQAKLKAAMEACKGIISSAQVLVFKGSNVFETPTYDGEAEHMLIYDSRDYDYEQRYMDVGTPTTNDARTMLGHVPGTSGIYYMVCAKALTIKNCAKVMKLLGCDYAVALDGGKPSQMRIKNGYGANGEVTSGLHENLLTGVCAYLNN